MGNVNSGPRSAPTALKLMRGVTRKDRLNPSEPQPPKGEVVKPTGLSATGGVVWDELAPICIQMGTLTTADTKPFGTLCELQATLQEASAHKDGLSLLTLRQEDADIPELTVVIDAVLKLERDTANTIRHYYALFGLEPVSRARMVVPKKAEPVSKWEGLK